MVFIIALFLNLICINSFAQSYKGIEIIEVLPVNHSVNGEDNLSDILRHCSNSFGSDHGRTTQAHETIHIINSYVRNDIFEKQGKKINAFYCDSGKAIIVKNPSLKIRNVSNFIPLILRGDRYNLYFIDQLQYWDDTPTYLIDEWSAYIAGAETGVEDVENGLPKENSDVVCGALEFSFYCVALCMATKEHDPVYWDNDERLKHTVNYFLIKAERVYFQGCENFPSNKQKIILNNLRTHIDAGFMRDFILKEFNGVFIK